MTIGKNIKVIFKYIKAKITTILSFVGRKVEP